MTACLCCPVSSCQSPLLYLWPPLLQKQKTNTRVKACLHTVYSTHTCMYMCACRRIYTHLQLLMCYWCPWSFPLHFPSCGSQQGRNNYSYISPQMFCSCLNRFIPKCPTCLNEYLRKCCKRSNWDSILFESSSSVSMFGCFSCVRCLCVCFCFFSRATIIVGLVVSFL